MKTPFTTLNVVEVTNPERLKKVEGYFQQQSAKASYVGAAYELTRKLMMRFDTVHVPVGNRPTKLVKRGFAHRFEVVSTSQSDKDKNYLTVVSHDAFAPFVRVDCDSVRFRTPVQVAEVPEGEGPSGYYFVAYRARKGRAKVFMMSAESLAFVATKTLSQPKHLTPIYLTGLSTPLPADRVASKSWNPPLTVEATARLKTPVVGCLKVQARQQAAL